MVCVCVVFPVMRKNQALTQWGQRYDGLDLLGQMRTSWDGSTFYCLIQGCMSSSSPAKMHHGIFPPPPLQAAPDFCDEK